LQVDGEDDAGVACEKCVGFSSFWDFLTAVAKVPAFCNANNGPAYARFGQVAMCAKEFASLVAVYVTQTGPAWNDLPVPEVDGVPVADYLAGGQTTEENRCVEGHDNYDETWCTELKKSYNNYTGASPFYTDRISFNTLDYYPRGAGYVMGIEHYYWMSIVIYGDDRLVVTPSLLATDPVTFWLAGLKTWMIPQDGRPAPHNIITGQWEPTEDELDIGLSDGMGAVSALLYGESQCGISKHPVANSRKSIYEGLIGILNADDGSWTAAETIYSWEDNGCEEVKRQAFPNDQDYAVLPQFAQTHYTDLVWNPYSYTYDEEPAYVDNGCFVVDYETDYIIWQKNAFKECSKAAFYAKSL